MVKLLKPWPPFRILLTGWPSPNPPTPNCGVPREWERGRDQGGCAEQTGVPGAGA